MPKVVVRQRIHAVDADSQFVDAQTLKPESGIPRQVPAVGIKLNIKTAWVYGLNQSLQVIEHQRLAAGNAHVRHSIVMGLLEHVLDYRNREPRRTFCEL